MNSNETQNVNFSSILYISILHEVSRLSGTYINQYNTPFEAKKIQQIQYTDTIVQEFYEVTRQIY